MRGALEFTPTEDLTFLGKLESFTTQTDGPAARNSGVYDRDSFDIAVDNIGSLQERHHCSPRCAPTMT